MPREFGPYMSALAVRLRQLVETLGSSGYLFAEPEHAFPGPLDEVSGTVARVEELVGPLPEALAAFYRTVGSVDLRGEHRGWRGCEYPDPLVVEPVSAVLEEAHEYAELKDPRRDYWASDSGVFRAPMAPDAVTKAGDSRGMWYGVEVPSSNVDPVVLEEPHALPFTEYLEFALWWGGFPGLASASEHTWPVGQLREAACRPTRQ